MSEDARNEELRTKNTTLLRRAQSGDAAATAELLELTYAKLKALANAFMKGERLNHTLQPTALVHEAYLHLIDADSVEWQGREHFVATAARAMRRVLVDHGRRRASQKRGGGWERTALADTLRDSGESPLDVLALEEALSRLQAFDERKARVIELRFFGGLTNEEAARVLDVSPRTVRGDWYAARAWLLRELENEDPREPLEPKP